MEDRLLQQLKKGVLEMLVLEIICQAPTYGYELMGKLKARSCEMFTLKEGTLYPILHSLEKDKLVTSREMETPGGRTRRYYHITALGLKALEEKEAEWRVYSKAVTAILAGA